tara:strand:+ start:8888 stop:9514 length:627 start_codon:yes stop_codon:yes gene_type:complete
MTKNNIELIKNFIEKDNQNLLINQVNDEIGCFYELVIEEISKSLNVNIYKNKELDEDRSNDLFSEKKVYLYNTTNSRQIEKISKEGNQNIILTDYKNYKKLLKIFVSINGYEFEKDLRYFLNNFFEIHDDKLINYCISTPYLMFSEVSKYKLNSENFIVDTLVKEEKNFILNLRKDIFNSKNSVGDLRKLFLKLKSEVNYKKFNFLVY